MAKTKFLRDSIEEQLKEAAGIPIRQNYMLPTVKPPFGVYLLKRLRLDGSVEQYDLTLDISDYSVNEDRLEEIADRIGERMEGLAVLDENQTWTSWLENQYQVPENDKNIQRIRLVFGVRFVTRLED